MKDVRALVITGFGLNCEAETAYSLGIAGATVEKVHLNDLIDGHVQVERFHILALIGGFSFGDHIGAGTVFANRLRHRLASQLEGYVRSGRLIIGLCNGFQVMVKLGLLPGFRGQYFQRKVSLVGNDSGVFRDAWIHLRANPQSPCVFTRGIETVYLPIRHGEGKFVTDNEATLQELLGNHQVALQYVDPETHKPTEAFPHNPNGSTAAIAGVCDPTGRIFGMMPHPEAYHTPYHNPHWTRLKVAGRLPAEGAGLRIFRNGVDFARAEL
jgi:phosphoribosylformylglycinamidine synthase subunit PurQ / glutaminase